MAIASREITHSPLPRSVPALDIHDLNISYSGVPALRGVNLTIEPGEISALLGPNGAGKSTLVSTVVGLRAPSSGTIRVCGRDVRVDLARVRAHTGFVPQEVAVYPTLTVAENLSLFGELAGSRGRDLRARVGEVLEELRLSTLANRRVGSLSGGERRRVHTAAALVHRPSLLLLDEPTAGADIETRAALLAFIRRLSRDGVAILYATHYLKEVEELAASVTILDQGVVLAQDTVEALIAQHGRATVELTFDGPPPESLDAAPEPGAVSTVRLDAAQPAALAAEVIGGLGEDARRLRSVEIVPPSLDAVFLDITGRRYHAGETDPDVEPITERTDVRRPEAEMTDGSRTWRGFSWRRSRTIARHGLRLYRRDLAWVILVLTMPIGVAAFLSPALGNVLELAGIHGQSGAAQVFPGMAVLFGLFLCGAVPIAIFNEHAWRTWDRLRASQATPGELVVGKVVPPLLLLLVQLVVLFTAGALGFDFRVSGSLVGFVAIAVAFACSVITLGLPLAVLCRTSLQANAVGNLIGIAGAGLGGAFVPVVFLPEWAARLGPVTPSYWAMRGWSAVTLADGGLADVALPIAMLLGFSLFFAVAGLTFFRVGAAKESPR